MQAYLKEYHHPNIQITIGVVKATLTYNPNATEITKNPNATEITNEAKDKKPHYTKFKCQINEIMSYVYNFVGIHQAKLYIQIRSEIVFLRGSTVISA